MYKATVILSPSAAMVEVTPSFWLIAPFAILLLLIAVVPLNAPRFWEKFHPWAAAIPGAFTSLVYLTREGGPHLLFTAAHEYVSFIALTGSLFVICGGIHIGVKGEATPRDNCLLLLLGALLANVVGTTGASMLLIRPWIRMNKYRITEFHIVFFIFIVSNVGGLLTPVGDPPLFLGYLKGIPFWWVAQHCWLIWCTAVAVLIAVFYLLDRKNFLRAPARVREAQTASETWKIRGWMNAGLLAAVQAALLLPTGWREGVLASAAWTSWKFTPRPIHEANDFTLDPIKEVGWLFAGLFLTMLPALELLRAHAANTGLSEPIHFFWATGFLSAILDNAPTYLAFLSAACGLHELDLQKNALKFALDHGPLLKAISTGAVFFGALTYIGNGPNLMVKHIAQQHKAATPSFGTYIWKYSLPVLLPILCVISILFFYR